MWSDAACATRFRWWPGLPCRPRPAIHLTLQALTVNVADIAWSAGWWPTWRQAVAVEDPFWESESWGNVRKEVVSRGFRVLVLRFPSERPLVRSRFCVALSACAVDSAQEAMAASGYALIKWIPCQTPMMKFWNLHAFSRRRLKPILAGYSVRNFALGCLDLNWLRLPNLAWPIIGAWKRRRQPLLGTLLNMLRTMLDGAVSHLNATEQAASETSQMKSRLSDYISSYRSMRVPTGTWTVW